MSSRQLWYDRQGRPISMEQADALLADRDYVVVAQDEQAGHRVSTVWLALDRGWGESDRPVIFETMIFGPKVSGKYCKRWCTEAEALAGHEQAIGHLRTEILGAGR